MNISSSLFATNPFYNFFDTPLFFLFQASINVCQTVEWSDSLIRLCLSIHEQFPLWCWTFFIYFSFWPLVAYSIHSLLLLEPNEEVSFRHCRKLYSIYFFFLLFTFIQGNNASDKRKLNSWVLLFDRVHDPSGYLLRPVSFWSSLMFLKFTQSQLFSIFPFTEWL